MTEKTEPLYKAGQALGPYRIVRCIGCGGMGEVYEVEHESLGVHYALKAFAYRGGKSWPMLRAKFMEEGQVLARLKHPNLVRVFDLSIDGATGVVYYAMDLVLYKDGNPYTLDDVDRTSVSEDHMFIWFRDLCNALDYIHSQGVVHRDVKLNNILLNADKHVTLSDFGIAHIFGDGLVKASAGACPTSAFDTPGSRMVLGTNHYTAPEVEDGEEPTAVADTYALGVAMFKMLTGVWYEPGVDVRALLAGGRWKYRWAEILPAMLAVEPAERPQILAQAVIGLLPSAKRTQGAVKSRTRRRRWAWFVAACVCTALVAIGGLCAGVVAWRAHEAELARRDQETERLRQETRRAEEEMLAKQKAAEDEAKRAKEMVSHHVEEKRVERQVEDFGKPTPDAGKAEPPKAKVDDENKEIAKPAETSKVLEMPAKEYRWRDGSGEPQEVQFEFGDGSVARLLPFKTAGSAFWMSRLPVTVAAWRALKGGYEGLDSLESTLSDGCPLCVVADRELAEAFCRAMTERVRASLPNGYEVRLATEEEMRIVLAEDETARLCEATGRSVDDCVEPSGAIACARFRRMKADCRLERFGGWTKNGELVGKRAVVAGLAMPRASGIVGLCKGGADTISWHLVVGRKLTDGHSEMEVFNGRRER